MEESFFFRVHKKSKGAEKIRKTGLAECELNLTGAKPGSDERPGEQIHNFTKSKVRQVPVLETVVNPSVQPEKKRARL